MPILAYVYPGWHPLAERDESFYPGFTEWDLVEATRPRFAGHRQPRLPALGRYDDRDPLAVAQRLGLALAHGVDGFVFGHFWCRGKRVFEAALDEGFLAGPLGASAPFALMWANRMPRRVLPVRRADLPVIDPTRLVATDIADFGAMFELLCARYFSRPNYLRLDGRVYFSIFDSTYFLKELGPDGAREAIERARHVVAAAGLGALHLAAIEPQAALLAELAAIGFDSVTHYVLLPYWKGPFLQDYRATAAARAAEWSTFAPATGLPYFPSVSPGWDASPRGADFGDKRPDKYPWWPIVVGESPAAFAEALTSALRFVGDASRPVFVASLNEWSEGHYLEPDLQHGNGWLEAVLAARRAAGW